MKTTAILIAAALFALPARAGGDSSDGHTHAAPAPLVPVTMAPRTSAASEEFEFVGVLDGTTLTVYLDRFSSNAPVAKARIEIESGAFKGLASEIGPGVYALSAAALARPGKHPLAISIEAGETADLLSATLDVGQGAPAAHEHGRSEWAVWGGAAMLLLFAGGLIALRRRKRAGHRRLGGTS